MYVYTYICIYVYVYIQRERERYKYKYIYIYMSIWFNHAKGTATGKTHTIMSRVAGSGP